MSISRSKKRELKKLEAKVNELVPNIANVVQGLNLKDSKLDVPENLAKSIARANAKFNTLIPAFNAKFRVLELEHNYLYRWVNVLISNHEYQLYYDAVIEAAFEMYGVQYSIDEKTQEIIKEFWSKEMTIEECSVYVSSLKK